MLSITFYLYLRQSRVAGGLVLSTWRFVRPFMRYQRRNNILKANEPFSLQIGTNGLRSKKMKRSTLGVKRSKVKVTRGRS